MAATKAQIIDGIRIARRIEEGVAQDAQALRARGITPHLITVQVGQDPATELYIRNQKRRFARLGIQFAHLNLDPATSQEGILSHIRSFNQNPTITGIMVTLPLPGGINPIQIQQEIAPEKDVEGVGPFNLGNLIYNRSLVGPCTALAVLEAIQFTGMKVEGKHAVVVGHSDIVGKPVTLCLLRDLATTTTCHIATRELNAETAKADILVVAVGKPGIITADMVKPGAVVIDVGINEIPLELPEPGRVKTFKPESGGGEPPGPVPARPVRIVGDVDYSSVSAVAAWITPVPGGIGPITVAMLARNTVLCAQAQAKAGDCH